jgi:hypothetical protein
VLENLDAKNTKALNRRAYASRVAQKWEEAVKDYQELNKVTGAKEAGVIKDLNFCMGKYMENIKKSNANGQAAKPTVTKPAAPQKKGPIIQEIPASKSSDFKKVNIIEDDSSEDSDDLMEAEKQKTDALKAKKEAEEAAL